jgi:uncharacterized protein YciI
MRAAVVIGLALASLAGVGGATSEGRTPESEPVRYHLGLLHRGPTWTRERSPRTDSLQAGHMANIRRMHEAGVLLAAGPFADDTPLRGVYVFRADTAYDLESEVRQDPAVASGRLRMDLHAWWAPPGIGEGYRERAALGRRDSMIVLHWFSLFRGPRDTSRITPREQRVPSAHPRHLAREAGRLLMASTVEGTGDLRGVLLFTGDSAAAHRAVAEDPAVRAGDFRVEYHPWWTAYGNIPEPGQPAVRTQEGRK